MPASSAAALGSKESCTTAVYWRAVLIPIGKEDTEVRRQPWVSYALIAANFLVFFGMSVAFDEDGYLREMSQKWELVGEYLAEHPYLEPPPEIATRLDEDFARALEAARLEYQQAGQIPDDAAVSAEQTQLQALVDDAMALRKLSPYQRFGYMPSRGGGLSLVSSMFIHGAWFHLLGNMLFFFLSGPFIEDLFGRPLFAILYLVSGAAAVFAHAVHYPTSDVPLIGASGAIAGVMGAFLVRLGPSRIKFLYMPFFPFFWQLRFTFFLPAFVVLPLWFGEQLFYAHTAGSESGVGWWAHIGGFVFGLVAAGAIRLFGIEDHFIHPSIEKQIAIQQHPGLEAALDARTRGEWQRARIEIRKVLAAEPTNLDAWSESYEIALGAEDTAEAGRSATRLLELYVNRGERELALQLIGDVKERVAEAAPARFLLSAAGFLEKDGDARTALDLYERLEKSFPTDPAALRALFRRGEILRKGGDSRGARDAYDRARQHPGFNDQMKQLVERALAELGGAPESSQRKSAR